MKKSAEMIKKRRATVLLGLASNISMINGINGLNASGSVPDSKSCEPLQFDRTQPGMFKKSFKVHPMKKILEEMNTEDKKDGVGDDSLD